MLNSIHCLTNACFRPHYNDECIHQIISACRLCELRLISIQRQNKMQFAIEIMIELGGENAIAEKKQTFPLLHWCRRDII